MSRFRLFITVTTLTGLLLADGVAQDQPPGGAPLEALRLAALPAPLMIVNKPVTVRLLNERTIELVAPEHTNLFNSPSGKFRVQNAPMLLLKPDRDFVLTAKVSAELRAVYDVAALVVYQDPDTWIKFCFENSVEKQATLVSVVTDNQSDDCNSLPAPGGYAYLAIVRKGDEFALHYSADGLRWQLIRHFSLRLAEDARLGFAAHGSGDSSLRAEFGEITYRAAAPANLRKLVTP